MKTKIIYKILIGVSIALGVQQYLKHADLNWLFVMIIQAPILLYYIIKA